jgi:hypothetical protein
MKPVMVTFVTRVSQVRAVPLLKEDAFASLSLR